MEHRAGSGARRLSDCEVRGFIAVVGSLCTGWGTRELVSLHWSLIPPWSKEPKPGYSTINARAETVAEKPTFRDAVRHRRCLIAADGYYEWRKFDRTKQPYFITLKDSEPYGFAGIWEHWAREGESVDSCAIIVTEANELTKGIHDPHLGPRGFRPLDGPRSDRP